MADTDSKDLTTGHVGRRLGVGAAALFAGIVVQQVAKFATNWLIARLMGAGGLGLFNYSLTFWSSIEMSFSGGLMRTVMRYVPHHVSRQEDAQASGVVRLCLIAAWVGGAVLGVLMYLLAEPIARVVLDKPEAAANLRVLALGMPLAALLGVVAGVGRSMGSARYVVFNFVYLPVGFALCVPVAAYLQAGAIGLAWGFVASYLVLLLPLHFYHRSLTRSLPPPDIRPVLRACAAFFGIACLMWFAEYIARNLDVLLVGRLRTTAETGVYTIASRTSTLPSMVMVAFNAFFSPTVAALYATGRLDELQATFRRASLWILIVSAPALGALMALAQPAMAFFGKEFDQGALALWVLCAGQFVNVGVGLVNVLLTMADRQHTVLACNLGGVAVSAGLLLLLVPPYGITGAAVATAAYLVLVPLALCVIAHRALGVSPLSRSTPKPLAASLVAGVVTSQVAPLLPGVPAQLLVGAALFLALYAGGMVALGEKDEALRAIRALQQAARRRRQGSEEPPAHGELPE